MKEAEEIYIVPQLVRNKFTDLVKLIYETESMESDERDYWMQIMPIMGEEQNVKFRGLLVNEKDQLNKLDAEYTQEMSRINNKRVSEISEAEMKAKKLELERAENAAEDAEKAQEEELLKKLEGL